MPSLKAATILAALAGTTISRSPSCSAPEATTHITLLNALGLANNFGASTPFAAQHYYASITVGDPVTEYWALLDTGSSDFWLPTAALDNRLFGNDSNITVPDPVHGSFTPHGNGNVVCNTSYVGSAFSGKLYDTHYSVGGFETNGPVCLADTGDVPYNPQGIMGIGGCGGSGNSAASGDLTNCPLDKLGWDSFGLYLSKDHGVNGTGTLSPNGVAPDLFEDDFVMESVVTVGNVTRDISHLNAWTVCLRELSIAEQSLPLSKPFALVDSGTAYISLEADAFRKLGHLLGGHFINSSATFSIPCNHAGSDLEVVLGSGTTYSIPRDVYTLPSLEGHISANSACMLGFIPGKYTILGVPFIQQYYSWFVKQDQSDGESYIGVAKAL